MKTKKQLKQSSYPIIMATIALMILGLALAPLLKVKLMPSRSLPSVSVYYNYGGANAAVADSEVTSKLEAIFSSLEGLIKPHDETGQNLKAVAMANTILEKKVKIPSTAIDEIKEEVQNILDKQASLQNSNKLKGKGQEAQRQSCKRSLPGTFSIKKVRWGDKETQNHTC